LVVAEVRDRLAVNKRAARNIDMERFNLTKSNEVEVKGQCRVTVTDKFAAVENLEGNGDINGAWGTVRENINISAKGSLGYCESKHHIPRFVEERSKLVVRRKRIKLQWLHDQSEVNEGDLSSVRWEASKPFRNKEREYNINKKTINELESDGKNENIRDLYEGIIEFKKSCQFRTNLAKDERVDLLPDRLKILNR
jgi:hypothetical protein